MPGGSARHAGRFEIRRLMADRTAHGWEPKAVCAALDRRLMQAALVALARAIAGWMAVHAARVGQHFTGLGK